MTTRRKTRKIRVGNLFIGGNSPISVQSMTKTDTRDVRATVNQIKRLERVGCEIVRVAVPDMEAANALGKIKKRINIPLVADIHFDYRLALEAIAQGVDKIRINPGNIGSRERVEAIAKAAGRAKIPIRVGVNAGSLKLPSPTKKVRTNPGHSDTSHSQRMSKAKNMVASALQYVKILEKQKFHQIVISLKASDVPTTIQAYRLIAKKTDYPLHLGITEAGSEFSGAIKSALGMGVLLSEGIGDTIRVSLTASPEEEVRVGYEILKALNLRSFGPEVISCPTCSRCETDLIKITNRVEKKLESLFRQKSVIAGIQPYRFYPLKIAIMGCVVNGPGEAREADVGIAGGKGVGLLFRRGKIIKKVKEKEMINVLVEEIEKEIRRR
ncbi:flavodoxin-dependent (E)-4-hydroxy-3-methylbut-2-enyl-diphosphate synthase [bacterium]|nr:flavodoxin-dependent (E)-4-hydroxy-3-methylbut-2-enyl-diphosphate synthase [bacterium]NIN93030.1 flavodoxin-dependent (E)-4-hydroxy-3-methylbut-2-enyl-diphosphate synthase [bacterium]NIO18899.1 flavodoxin-dependent (E)-4-hydroxy-3-methylbut-2-enyl-diphosphate synthase [bacterium]NIO73980.1 flavodoxin-dependent (E)-4-hydroxy-3-methylbut-2-enyl-diphosphate synthase [bacterium]